MYSSSGIDLLHLYTFLLDPPVFWPPPPCINVSYLQSRAFVWRSLTGSLPFQAQLNKKLQQVDQQLVDHLLRLKVGRYVTQSVYHSQGTVSTKTERTFIYSYTSEEAYSHTHHFLMFPCSPVSMVFVVFGGVDHGASFDADLLEQIPHLLVDVLLK